jgi:hypothetical protein
VGSRHAFALGLVASTGCSLLVSLDDLDRGSDAAADAADAADVEVADVSDAGVADAIDELTKTTACAIDASTVFCDDFDDSDAQVFPKWSNVIGSRGATVVRIASDASSPFCAELSVPTNDGGPQALLQRSFATTPASHVTYAFNLRVVRYPSGNARFNAMSVQYASSQNATAFLALRQASAIFEESYIDDGGVFDSLTHTLTQALPLGVWVAVRIEWTLGDAGTLAQVFVGGAPATAQVALDPRAIFGAPTLFSGVSYQDPGADGAVIDIDDVVIGYD